MGETAAKANGTYALRQQLGFKLSRAARLMQQRLDTKIGEEGLTRLSWCVLSSIGLEGITAPSGVAENLGVTRPTLSRLIKSMTADGLIQSALTHGDGRNRKLSLTPKGQQKLEKCWPMVQGNNVHFSSKLTAEREAQFHEMLDVLLEGEQAQFDTV